MAEFDRKAPWAGWRPLRIVALSMVLVGLSGGALGYTVAVMRHEDFLTATHLVPIALLALALLGCGWLLVREIRAPTGEDPLTPQERLNRNFHIASGVLVVVLLVATFLAFGPAAGTLFRSNDPLPPAVAIVAILMFAVLLPAISFYWHRIIDEQEADAYKTGALFALYAFAIGAPVWWLAWRGGFAPPPDGFVIYLATLTVASAIWLWKKYR
jgi:hypothetical protein